MPKDVFASQIYKGLVQLLLRLHSLLKAYTNNMQCRISLLRIRVWLKVGLFPNLSLKSTCWGLSFSIYLLNRKKSDFPKCINSAAFRAVSLDSEFSQIKN